MLAMTKDDIITLPNASLRKPSKKVGFINEDILAVIDDMKSATLDWEASRQHELGVALAAVQINKMLKIVVVRNNYDDKDDKSFTVLINPEITKKEGTPVEDYEGCLSVKDIYGLVRRYPKIRVRATDINGRQFSLKADGFLARILQHEIDHTQGIVFVDHIKDDPEAFYRLNDKDGKLQKLDYDKEIRQNSILWQ